MDIPVQVHFDIIAAALNGLGILWVFPGPVHPADKIIIHTHADSRGFVNGVGIQSALDIGISQRVGFLRAEASLDGSPANNGAEHNGAYRCVAHRVSGVDFDSVRNVHGGAEGFLVVQISQPDHFQHGLFRIVHPMTIRWFPMVCSGKRLNVIHKHIADLNSLTGDAVVEHSQISGEDGILAGRNPIDGLVKAAQPGRTVAAEIFGSKAPIDAVHGGIGIEYRPDHMAPIEYVFRLLKGRAPDKAGIAAEEDGGISL